MFRKFGKVLLILLSCYIVFLFTGCNSIFNYWSDISYRYTVVDGGFEITSYSVNENFDYSKPLELPSEYKGEKVIGIGTNVFFNSNFTSITLPSNLEYIAPSAFMSCKKLLSVKNSSNKLYKIDSYAFQNCINLSDFNIPNSLTYLGDLVFDNTALKQISFPENLTRIGFSCFSNTSIEEIEFTNSVSTITQKTFKNTSIEMLIIPETVKIINNSAFADNKFLSSVVLYDGVHSIGNNAFENCTKLEEILIPKSVSSIGDNAFNNVSSSFRIRCPKNSYAEKYAKKNKINYIIS